MSPLTRSALALLLVAASASAAWIPSTAHLDSCPSKSMILTTEPKDLSACYKSGYRPSRGRQSEASRLLAVARAAALAGQARRGEMKPPTPSQPLGLPYSPIGAYNTLAGSTLIGTTYTFTSDPFVLEGAKSLAAAGARVHKFMMSTFLDNEKKQEPLGSLLEAALHPKLGYSAMFDLPTINRYVFWAYAVNKDRAYEEFYELAVHLITRYQATGKSFYIGHWEGDWAIRNNYTDPVIPSKVAHFRRQLSEMQRAIDDAKADYAHLITGEAGVKVWGYAEVNRVLKAMKDPNYKAYVNQVLPFINPPIDFVSYSNWEIEEEVERSAEELSGAVRDTLDFINCHLPAKPCVPEPRAFVGEYGYFLKNKNCTSLTAPPAEGGAFQPMTPETVKSRTLWHLANSIAWGSPFTLFWQLYSNEPGVDAEGKTCDRAFWLVDTAGADAPVYTALKRYWSAADAHVEAHAAAHGGARPDANAFREWAVGKLTELAGYAGRVAPPVVRRLDPAAAAIAGGH